MPVHRVAVEAAADMIVDTARRQRVKGLGDHLQDLAAAGLPSVTEQEFEDGRLRELAAAAESGVVRS